MLCEVNSLNNGFEVDVDDLQVKRWRRRRIFLRGAIAIFLPVLYPRCRRTICVEIEAFNDACIGKDEIEALVFLERAMERGSQLRIIRDVRLVEGGCRP